MRIRSKPRFREWSLFRRRLYLVREDGLVGNIILFDSNQIGVTAAVTVKPSQRAAVVYALRNLANQMEASAPRC